MKITTLKQTLPEDQISPEFLQTIKNRGRFIKRPAQQADAKSVQLTPVSNREEFAALQSEWDAFILKTQSPSPFLNWDYLDVWWETYGDRGFDNKLYIARDSNGTLIGAAPLMISQKGAFPGARSKFRHLAIMGGVGDLLGECLELPALPGYEVALGEATAKLILEKFRGQWDVLYFYLVPHDSRSTNTMLRNLAKAGIGIKTVSSEKSPYLPINGSWDDACNERSKKTRDKIRKAYTSPRGKHKHKRLIVGQDIEFEKAYEELVRLSEARWGSDEIQAFHTPGFIDFHWKLAPRYLKDGRMFFGLIEIDGKIVGAVYDFIFNNSKWTYQMPWDPAYKNASVGVILNYWAMAHAHEAKLEAVEFLPGESGFKDRWAKYHRVFNIYEAACPRSMGGTLFSLARGIDRLLNQKEKPVTVLSHE
ncbi:hypothetical protein NT6N_03450 [Oceaniferula spumae]|uniref:N-acetyltransferase domain-containing protein n=1 Tax=Oceaniferula spumae TaxID=2979115 RepID=A0AAT9FH56_9BACT